MVFLLIKTLKIVLEIYALTSPIKEVHVFKLPCNSVFLNAAMVVPMYLICENAILRFLMRHVTANTKHLDVAITCIWSRNVKLVEENLQMPKDREKIFLAIENLVHLRLL